MEIIKNPLTYPDDPWPEESGAMSPTELPMEEISAGFTQIATMVQIESVGRAIMELFTMIIRTTGGALPLGAMRQRGSWRRFVDSVVIHGLWGVDAHIQRLFDSGDVWEPVFRGSQSPCEENHQSQHRRRLHYCRMQESVVVALQVG